KAGFRCFLTPRVGVRYFPRASLQGLYRQMIRYGRGRVRLLRKHPDTFSLPGLAPALFLLGLLLGPVAALFNPWLAAAYLGGLALYSSAVLLVSLGLGLRSPRLLPWLPLVFGVIHCGAGAGILLEFLSSRRIFSRLARSRWQGRLRQMTRSPLSTR